MRPRKIFLVRHGQSEWNGTKRISGQLDPPLSEKGRQQANMLREALRHEKLSAIYTSTLARAITTAMPAAEDQRLPIQTKDAFKEMHFGILQGRFRDGRDPLVQQYWMEREADKLNYRIPHGETFAELEQRVAAGLDEILAEEAHDAVLIVGHRGANRVLLGKLMHWRREDYIDLDLRSKYLYEIFPEPQPRLRTICLDEKKLGQAYAEFKM